MNGSRLPLVLSTLALIVAIVALVRTFDAGRPAPAQAPAAGRGAPGPAPGARAATAPRIRPPPDPQGAGDGDGAVDDLLPDAAPMDLQQRVKPVAPPPAASSP
jgi:hypothetical protein